MKINFSLSKTEKISIKFRSLIFNNNKNYNFHHHHHQNNSKTNKIINISDKQIKIVTENKKKVVLINNKVNLKMIILKPSKKSIKLIIIKKLFI